MTPTPVYTLRSESAGCPIDVVCLSPRYSSSEHSIDGGSWKFFHHVVRVLCLSRPLAVVLGVYAQGFLTILLPISALTGVPRISLLAQGRCRCCSVAGRYLHRMLLLPQRPSLGSQAFYQERKHTLAVVVRSRISYSSHPLR